jgi:hypothetical protein
MDDSESSRLRKVAAVKRKQLAALLSRHRQHCNTGSAVTVVKSAVDIRIRPRRNKTVFLKRERKNKNKSKEAF